MTKIFLLQNFFTFPWLIFRNVIFICADEFCRPFNSGTEKAGDQLVQIPWIYGQMCPDM